MVTINGKAITLVNLIYGTEIGIPYEKSTSIELAVDCMGITDDAKADLYSLLEESLEKDTPYFEAVSKTKAALLTHYERYPHG